MAPRRPKQRIDNCAYVQQLFKTFLLQNQTKKVFEVLPRSFPQPVQRFPIDDGYGGGLFRQGVKRNLLKVQQDAGTTNTVKDFFFQTANKHQSERGSSNANQPVQVRFKRQAGSDQFVQCKLSPSAPTRGLARWLSFRKKIANEQKLAEQQNKPSKTAGEYLELSGNFFSGREPIKLPFEAPTNNDKTLMSVVSTFVPPATSTPFDGKQIVSSSIILDPIEMTNKEGNIQTLADSESFLKSVERELDTWCASLIEIENSTLNRNYHALKEHLMAQLETTSDGRSPTLPVSLAERRIWKEHSLLSNQMYHRKQKTSPSLFTNFGNFDDTSVVGCDQIPNHVPGLETTNNSFETFRLPNSQKRKIVDSILTASPPSPISNFTQFLSDDTLLETHLSKQTNHDTLQFDFEYSQPSHSFDEIFSFDEPRENDSFCFFPPTVDKFHHALQENTLFPAFEPSESNKSSFFDLYP